MVASMMKFDMVCRHCSPDRTTETNPGSNLIQHAAGVQETVVVHDPVANTVIRCPQQLWSPVSFTLNLSSISRCGQSAEN